LVTTRTTITRTLPTFIFETIVLTD
jgi:hypothetical protein